MEINLHFPSQEAEEAYQTGTLFIDKENTNAHNVHTQDVNKLVT